MVSRFVEHVACPHCHSRDNLGVWEDGHKYCFGCGYYEHGENSVREVFSPKPCEEKLAKDFPYDASDEFPAIAMKWLLSCGIDYSMAIKHGIKWSNYRQMLCWQIKGVKGNIIGWQGRCFSSDAKTKYFSQGKLHEDICILTQHFPLSTTVVLVEDYMSAMRVSTYLPCMPLFGCTCALDALSELRKRFTTLYVWVDPDKLDNARRIAQNASIVGLEAKVIYTPKDPKEYTNEEITEILYG